MKVEWNSKYSTISVYTVITFACCLGIVLVAMNFESIWGTLKTAADTLAAVSWGIIIAYLLNPVMMKCEQLLKKVIEKKKPHPKVCRFISTFLAIAFGIAVICALIAIIVPQVIESLMSIFDSVPTYMNNMYDWINKQLNDYPEIMDYVNTQLETIQSTVISWMNNIIPKVGDWAIKLKDGAVGFAVAIKDFLIGFIVAVYLLLDKEKFIAMLKKMITALFPEKARNELFRIAQRTNQSLSGFIGGKILDSALIGMLCFIAMTLMKLDFPVLISVIIGVTNIIPFFGPFIGAIPSALLILLADPSKTFIFILLIFLLQQLDGNIIGPFILGDTTGLPAFWVMFAIFLGGGLFGFAGMLLGVPIFAVIYTLVQEILEYLLNAKGLSTNTEDYYPKPNEKKKVTKKERGSKKTAEKT